MKNGLGKHGFRIVPKNKKLLKSSKVRKWFETVEDRIQEELDLREKRFWSRMLEVM